MATKNFPLLEIPRELRDSIYHEALCDWPAPQSTRGQLAIHLRPITRVYHKINTALLRVNRQVSVEALEVMIKSNLFIRVVTHGVDMNRILRLLPVPILSMNTTFVKQFTGFIMTHCIANPREDSYPSYHLAILRRDLDMFCRVISMADIHIPRFGSRTIHSVVIHDLFKNTNYFGPTKQVSLRKYIPFIYIYIYMYLTNLVSASMNQGK